MFGNNPYLRSLTLLDVNILLEAALTSGRPGRANIALLNPYGGLDNWCNSGATGAVPIRVSALAVQAEIRFWSGASFTGLAVLSRYRHWPAQLRRNDRHRIQPRAGGPSFVRCAGRRRILVGGHSPLWAARRLTALAA